MAWKDKLKQETAKPPAPNLDPELQVDTGFQEAQNIASDVLTEHVPAAFLNALQVPTAGFADELMAGTPVGDFREQHAETYPAADTLAQVSTGLGLGMGTGPAILSQTARIPSGIGQIATNLGLAGTSGALYGLGTGEGSFMERLPGAGLEGLIGVAAGPVGTVAGRIGSTVLDPIMEYGGRMLRNAPDQASTLIGRQRARSGMPTDADSINMERAAIDPTGSAMIINADLDDAARQQLVELFNENPSSRQGIREYLEERQQGASRRVVDDISSITGANRDMRKMVNDLVESNRRNAAQKGYKEIYESSIPINDNLFDMFTGPESPELKKAYREAYKIAAREQDYIPPYEQVFGESGSLENIPVKAADYMQRAFRRQGTQAGRLANADSLSIDTLRNRFLTEVDQAVPGFAQVRKDYATSKGIENALEEGKKLYRLGDARDVMETMADMSTGELSAFRRGAIDAIENRVRTARTKSGNIETRMAGSIQDQELLQGVFGDKYEDVMKVLSREDAFNRTASDVLFNSKTAQRLRGLAEMPKGESPTEKAMNAAGTLLQRAGGQQREATITALIDQLMSTGYTEQQAKRIARSGMSNDMATQFGRGFGTTGVLAAPVLVD